MGRRLDFRAPWASCVTCRELLVWHDGQVCAMIGEHLAWLGKLRQQ